MKSLLSGGLTAVKGQEQLRNEDVMISDANVNASVHGFRTSG